MSKVLVCIEDSLLGIRIGRILTNKAIAYDLVNTPIKKEDLLRYDTLIIHSSYKLTGLYSFVEHVLIHQTLPVIYISLNTQSNTFQRLSGNEWFVHIDESKMDSELPLSLIMFQKSKHKFESLISENKDLTVKLKTEVAVTKCKKHLLSIGLSEEEAHKLILKAAMDNKISKYDACLKILSEK